MHSCYVVTGARTPEVTNNGMFTSSFGCMSSLKKRAGRLSFYCDDDTIDAFPLAFLYVFFGKGGKPMLDLSNVSPSWMAIHDGIKYHSYRYAANLAVVRLRVQPRGLLLPRFGHPDLSG